jgi:hypothetical protein
MQLGLNDIDPAIAEAMLERLAAPPPQFLKDNIHWGNHPFGFSWEFHAQGMKVKRKRNPGEDERKAFELRKQRDNTVVGRAILTMFAPLLAALGLGMGLDAALHSAALDIIAATGTLGAGITAGVLWTRSATPKARLARYVRLEEMRAVFPLLSLTRAERLYCDTLLLLARLEASAETERMMRETLDQLNQLMVANRQLEQRRMALLPLLGNNVIAELETEYGELGRRLDETRDAISRQSLQQSLQMCQTRLENAKQLRDGLERLKLQQEAIVQTISTAQTAMARLQIAPQPQTEFVAQEIAQTVTQMNQQTYAVERAVEEVMTLGVQNGP